MNSLVALLIAAPSGGILGAIVVALTNRYKNRSDGQLSQVQAAKVAQGMALDMVEPLKGELAALRAEGKELRIDGKQLRARMACLERKERVRDKYIQALVDHIEQGNPPPPPPRPPELDGGSTVPATPEETE